MATEVKMSQVTENTQARRWCFTWNNYPGDMTSVKDNDEPWKQALDRCNYCYCTVGFEEAETGTKHLQGYFEFTSGKRFGTLKKLLPGVHLEKCKGSALANREYCQKTGLFWESGEAKSQGKRTDYHDLMEDVREGVSEYALFDAHPRIMFNNLRAVDRYCMLWTKRVLKEGGYKCRNVKVYYGGTGTGKTRTAYEESDDPFILSTTQTGLWWDGYECEKDVILDEFRDSAVPLAQLLRILDGYPVSIPIKGGMKILQAENVIITSNVCPDEWYMGCDMKSREALFRRFKEIWEFNGEDRIRHDNMKPRVQRHFNPMVSHSGDNEWEEFQKVLH